MKPNSHFAVREQAVIFISSTIGGSGMVAIVIVNLYLFMPLTHSVFYRETVKLCMPIHLSLSELSAGGVGAIVSVGPSRLVNSLNISDSSSGSILIFGTQRSCRSVTV